MLVWVIPAGLVGTRIYHIITDWVPISQWHKIWEGGLGIPGGIIAGVAGGVLFTKRRGISTNNVIDAMIPTVPLAQAIGRLGNWWNQELYGRPTDLPWGLEIDADHRRPGFEEFDTFHPTFLYEMIWNLGLVAFLIWFDRKRVLKPGRLIWVYGAGYAIGRLWIESVRIDNATEIAGVRVNIWMMSLVLIVSLAILSKSFIDRDAARDPGADTGTDLSEHSTATDEDDDDAAAEDDDGRTEKDTDTRKDTDKKGSGTAKSGSTRTATKKTSSSKATTNKPAQKKSSAKKPNTKKKEQTKSADD
ncbi:UNVERIFIED_CONTAM: hypothetical protein GTU68_024085 [Idotea baltica]|nr:hypothetical protein [Idotea baltica]